MVRQSRLSLLPAAQRGARQQVVVVAQSNDTGPKGRVEAHALKPRGKDLSFHHRVDDDHGRVVRGAEFVGLLPVEDGAVVEVATALEVFELIRASGVVCKNQSVI